MLTIHRLIESIVEKVKVVDINDDSSSLEIEFKINAETIIKTIKMKHKTSSLGNSLGDSRFLTLNYGFSNFFISFFLSDMRFPPSAPKRNGSFE